MSRELILSPSMLSADFSCLGQELTQIVKGGAKYIHIDVMDGAFVPNISFGMPVMKSLKKWKEANQADLIFDVHLMIVNPEKYVERFAKVGASMISFHLNATEDPAAVLRDIRSLGVKAGLVINPDIPVESLYPYLKDADFILLMSVFAGFGGQKFIEDTYVRIRTLREEIARQGLDLPIEVDGGVGPANAKALIEAGAEILVAGSAVFKAEDPADVVARMRG